MNEKQLLDAIRGIVKEEISSVREETTSLEERLTSQISELREDLTAQNRHTRILVEQEYGKIRKLLHEDYSGVAEAARKGVALVEPVKELQGKALGYDRALENHNQKITELEKKAANE